MDSQITRREVLKRGLIGAAGLTVLPSLIAACGASSATATSTAKPTPVPATPTPNPDLLTGKLTLGSNQSNASGLKGVTAVNDAFKALTTVAVTTNTVDNGSFRDQISTYLSSSPDDVFFWQSGFRMRFFVDKGLATPIDDVWAKVSSNFAPGFASSVVGNDGKVYGIPIHYDPWCVVYRKSVFADKKYTVPQTWADLIALCKKMQSDGLTPFAFGDKDGWPALGMFDILNLRLNGCDFHVGLLGGKEKWTDPKVTAVFQKWAELIPYYSHGYKDLTWQQACDSLVRKTAGLYFLGMSYVIGETATVDITASADLDFFPFPFFGNTFDAEQALDAPIDVVMVSAKSAGLTADLVNAKAYCKFWAKGSTQTLMYQANSGFIPTASDADATKFDLLTQKAVQIVGKAQKISQFFDRDTRPDFASANAMQSLLLYFLKTPSQDLTKLQASIQAYWDALPTYKG